jgi:hypothetical protein
MTFYDTNQGDLPPYKQYCDGHREGTTLYQPCPANMVESMRMVDYNHIQDNVGFDSFSNEMPFSPPTHHDNSSSPLQASSSPHLGHVSWYPLDLSVSSSSSDLPFTPTTPSHHVPSTSTTSPPVSAPPTDNTTTVATTAITAPAHSTSQRAKFACTICGKMCTSRPRADTCFFKHMGIKPFACNGDCGVAHW